MATNKRISELDLSAAPVFSDVFPVVNGGTTKKMTLSQIATVIQSSLSLDWGQVSKVLSSLADLETRSAADLSSGNLAIARLGLGVTTLVTSTSTGQNDGWAPGIAGDTVIEWSGASDMTCSGVSAAAGFTAGQRVTVKNTGTKVAYFQHNNAGSTVKFKNIVTSGDTPIAPGGCISWVYDGTHFKLSYHDQGAFISVAYSAGNFTTGSGSWTVDSGDQITYAYKIQGSEIKMRVYLDTTSIGDSPGSAPLQLFVAIPGGYTAAKKTQSMSLGFDNGVATATYNRCGAGDTTIEVARSDVAPWTVSTNLTYIRVYFDIEVN